MLSEVGFAQSVTTANDGTGTIINQDATTFSITGGTAAGNNLFHSFEQFGLSDGQVANFIGNPQLANILGRVTGGDVSLINGLLQVSNSDANLYLINPAGFVFGADAHLDLSGNFAATTATRIGIGDQFFNAFGTNDYSNLGGAPSSFVFDTGTGMILNQGDLAVAPEKSLWLVGSSVLNLGSISGGDISIVAMPEQRQIKVNANGSLLSLALDAASIGGETLPVDINLFTSTDLPKYLTGNATPEEQDLVASIITGDVGITGAIAAENVQLMAAGKVIPTDTSLIQTGVDGVGGLTVVRFRESLEDSLGYTFIDQRADNPEQLLFGGEAGTIATIVLKQEAGLEAVTNALLEFAATGQKLDAVNIVAEGNQGYFWLGNELVDGETLEAYQSQLQQWRGVLGDGADLLLYSCFTALGMNGEAFIQQLTDLTGADVAASLDVTGSENFGGNWELEYSTGVIEASNPFSLQTVATWEGKLAVITVTSAADNLTADGLITLREALQAANGDISVDGVTGSGADEIVFDTSGVFSTPQTITTTLGQFVIGGNGLVITGTGQDNLFLDGNNTNRVFNIGGNATIENVTIQNGNGGGIYHNGGTLNINNSTISGSSGLFFSAAIYNNSGNLNISNSTIANNNIGGILIQNGVVNIDNSTISGNSAAGSGGGIYNTNLGSLNITNSTISGNTATSNGGGIFHNSVGGNLSITNSTISGNSATGNGGGVSNNAIASITNSIIANSPSGGDVHNTGTLNLNGNNLIEDGTISGAGTVNGTITHSGDPLLSALGDFGGSTETFFLLPGSPALDAGDNASVATPTDQRGGTRTVGTVDLGALEFQGYSFAGTTLSIASGNNQSTTVNTAFGNPLVVSASGATEITFNNPISIEGQNVTFTAPSTGASTNPNVTVASFNTLGQASFIPTANTVAGNYQVQTSLDTKTVDFSLTNLADIPNALKIATGNNQNTVINTAFANDLAVNVFDQYGNVVSGVPITFSAQVGQTGASGLLNPTSGVTDINGLVSVSLKANNLGGAFQVSAGNSTLGNVNFNLENVIFNDNSCSPECNVAVVETEPLALERFEQINDNNCPPECNVAVEATEPLALEPSEQSGAIVIVDNDVAAVSQQEQTFATAEAEQSAEYSTQLGVDAPPPMSIDQAQDKLAAIDEQTNTTTAYITLRFVPSGDRLNTSHPNSPTLPSTTTAQTKENTKNISNYFFVESGLAATTTKDSPRDPLEVIITTATDTTVQTLPITRWQLQILKRRLIQSITTFERIGVSPRRTNNSINGLNQIHKEIFAPLEETLQAMGIDNLLLSLGRDLRSIPWGALYDGEKFLIEKYSLAITPNLSFTDTTYRPLHEREALVMGASDFKQLNDLPAVPIELATITQQFGDTKYFLNEDFTQQNLVTAREETAPGIIHLATHAAFKQGSLDKSYIHLWGDEQLPISEIDQLRWLSDPPVELLVLSACQTALGEPNAELGFGGLAVKAGVRSAVASLWQVSDVGTLALMSEFYRNLRDPNIRTKAEALRQAQISLIRGDVQIDNDQLRGVSRAPYSIDLPDEFSNLGQNWLALTHPYYWAPFTLIGSPW